MIRLGVHTSIAGGLHRSLERAHELGCNTLQIFCHSPRSWNRPEYSKEEIERFVSLRRSLSLSPLFVHCSYLINLSSPSPDVRERSIGLLAFELEMLRALEADYLVLHPGRAVGQPLKKAIELASEGIKRAVQLTEVKGRILLENTAGQKGDISSEIPLIAEIADLAGPEAVGGICIDTCHAFQAGYDVSTGEGVKRVFSEIKRYLSPLKVELIHLNDSKRPLSSGLDRHEHIGSGYIGEKGFCRFLNSSELKGIPLILETPKESIKDDIKNLSKVKALLEEKDC